MVEVLENSKRWSSRFAGARAAHGRCPRSRNSAMIPEEAGESSITLPAISNSVSSGIPGRKGYR